MVVIRKKAASKNDLVSRGLFCLGLQADGNKKLVNNKDTRFLIWSLPAVKTCPFATKHCIKFCYALKAERIYSEARANRERNFKESMRADFVIRMITTIEYYDRLGKGKRKLIVRIHESGDFYNQEYANKWMMIAAHFIGRENIVFVAYTKSTKYFVDYPDNLVVRASVWDDTCKSALKDSERFPIYTAYDQATIDKMSADGVKFHLCRCEDCATCGKCWDKSEKLILCKIH